MAAFTEITGSAAISTTEWSLATNTSFDAGDAQTSEGYLTAMLDLSDMVPGDHLEIRLYRKVRSGDPLIVFYRGAPKEAQSEHGFAVSTLPVKHGWDVTCKALSGTITVNWSLCLAPMT